MEKDLDSVVKTTQTSLGKFIKRPPLTDKLLKKPPFRFLHDIVTNLIKSTGFFEGLFDEEELVSDNVKDRESKILFLNKVITVVGLVTGKVLSVKASKIVAGQEPDKTNELLQCLAHALDQNLTSTDAIKQYKQDATPPKPQDKKQKDPLKPVKKSDTKLTSKSTEKLPSQKKDNGKHENEKSNVSKTKQKEKTVIKSESPPKKTSQPSKPVTKKQVADKQLAQNHGKIEKVKSEEKETKEIANMIINNDETLKQSLRDNVLSVKNTPIPEPKDVPDLNSSYTIVDHLNSSLSSQDLMDTGNDIKLSHDSDKSLNNTLEPNISSTNQHHQEEDIEKPQTIVGEKVSYSEKEKPVRMRSSESEHFVNELETSQIEVNHSNPKRPFSVRPSSSRPGAPKLREKHDTIISEAENVLVGKVNIIAENAPNEEDDETSLFAEDQKNETIGGTVDDNDQFSSSINQHGHLVQQILDSQKEYSQMSRKTEIEWKLGAQKTRDTNNKEIEQLRFDIQALSRVANPLGKLMDHIQEDVEVMRQELHQWTTTYENASKELAKQKAANEDSLSPLRTKVKQLDADIMEKREKINDLKIIIHKNSFRIEKLLASGQVQY